MYRPSIPPNNHLPVEKQHEITEIILSRYLWHYDSPETRRHISKMLDRTLRIGSLLKIIDK
jgi:hypothetical protein